MKSRLLCLFLNWMFLLSGWPLFAHEKESFQLGKYPLPTTLSKNQLAALTQEGVRFESPDLRVTIWLRKLSLLETTSEKSEKMKLKLTTGSFVGVCEFTKPWLDFRGLEIPAGVYSLRFARQPKSTDHEDTSPSSDFFVLSPISEDSEIGDLTFAELKKRSGKATGGTHPVAMVLLPSDQPNDGIFRPRESWIAIQWKWTSTSRERLAVVVKGVWNGK